MLVNEETKSITLGLGDMQYLLSKVWQADGMVKTTSSGVQIANFIGSMVSASCEIVICCRAVWTLATIM